MPRELIIVPEEKKFVSRYNARRQDKGLRFQVEKQHMMAHVRNTPDLAECEPESIGQVMLQAAGLGLSLNPVLAHVYPIPYRDSATGRKYAQVLVGYRGLLHGVQQAGTIAMVQPGLVREGDPMFQAWTDETGRHFRHEEARSGRGKVTHAYVLAKFTAGGHHVEIMDAQQLEACEKAASKRNERGGAVWRGPFRDQMQIKAVIRRAWKYWPKDDGGHLERVMAAMEEAEPMGEAGQPEVCISDEQAIELHAACTDCGMDAEQADRWLARLAQRHGLSHINNVPASQFERVRDELFSYLRQWQNTKGYAK